MADIAASEAQVFTKGRLLMDGQSQLLTTFITPFGHFKYWHAPSAAEIRSIINQSSQENARIQELQDHAKRDDTYQPVILQGFPDHKRKAEAVLAGALGTIHTYYMAMAMRKKILECLHSSTTSPSCPVLA